MPTPDMLEMMADLYPVVIEDNSLAGITAWNDNGNTSIERDLISSLISSLIFTTIPDMSHQLLHTSTRNYSLYLSHIVFYILSTTVQSLYLTTLSYIAHTAHKPTHAILHIPIPFTLLPPPYLTTLPSLHCSPTHTCFTTHIIAYIHYIHYTGYSETSSLMNKAYRTQSVPGLAFLLKKSFYDKFIVNNLCSTCTNR